MLRRRWLSMMIASLEAEEKIASVLEKSIFARLGVKARHLGHSVQPMPSSNPRRSYYIYSFDIGGEQPFELFVKCGPSAVKNSQLETFVGEIRDTSFRAPRYFGAAAAKGERFAAWELIRGSSPRFTDNLLYLERVVTAVAAANSHGKSALDSTNLQIKNAWIAPVAQKVAEWGASQVPPMRKALRKKLELFAEHEQHLIERASEIDAVCLSHNDIKYENIIQSDNDPRLAIIDWASASVSIPGASLRFLGWWDESVRVALVARYAEEMRRLGVNVSLETALFGLNTTQVFWGLQSGVQRNNYRRIRLALTWWKPEKNTPKGYCMKPVSEQVKAAILEFAGSKKGRVY